MFFLGAILGLIVGAYASDSIKALIAKIKAKIG